LKDTSESFSSGWWTLLALVQSLDGRAHVSSNVGEDQPIHVVCADFFSHHWAECSGSATGKATHGDNCHDLPPGFGVLVAIIHEEPALMFQYLRMLNATLGSTEI
jgi:hypothetical protein